MKVEKKKVLVVGLDGSTFKLINPWIRSGSLPTLRWFFDEGVHGILLTVIPTISILAWPCFYTGKTPAKLSDYSIHFMENPLIDIKSMESLNSTHVGSPSLWKILSLFGKTVGVVNVPVTYPPEEVNGFLVSGFLTPTSAEVFTYPSDLSDRLVNYKIDLDFARGDDVWPITGVDKRETFREQLEITESRIKNSINLIKTYDPDFFIVNFKGIDNMQHLFWNEQEKLLNYYRRVDGYINKLYKAMKPSYIFIISDHGAHESAKRYFYVNSWLEKEGYLVRKKGKKMWLANALLSLGLNMTLKIHFICKLLPEKLMSKIVSTYWADQIDFERSKAFASRWGIFVNKSIIMGKKRVTFIQKIKEKSLSLKAEDETKIFKEVVKSRDAYGVELPEDFPDLFFLVNPKYMVIPNLTDYLFSYRIDKLYLQGEHKAERNGILIVSGEEIKNGFKIKGARIMDIVPTILHIMGVPIPSDMDGKVLSQLFKEGSSYGKKVVKCKPILMEKIEVGLSKEEQKEIRKRLEKLGYIQ